MTAAPPAASAFIDEAPSDTKIVPAVADVVAPVEKQAPRRRPGRKAEASAHGPLPPRHRLLSSGELKRQIIGFVTPELGVRVDQYLEQEERNMSYVLQRALTQWLDSRESS